MEELAAVCCAFEFGEAGLLVRWGRQCRWRVLTVRLLVFVDERSRRVGGGSGGGREERSFV